MAMHIQMPRQRLHLALLTALFCSVSEVISQKQGLNKATASGSSVEPPPWVDETFMDEQKVAKEAAAKLKDEAVAAHEQAKEAAIAAQRKKIEADEAMRAVGEKARQAEEDYRLAQRKIGEEENEYEKSPDVVGYSAEGASVDSEEDGGTGEARRLSDPLFGSAASVTLITMSSASDLLPLELTLPHQVSMSSREGRERLEKVLVVKMPESPHHTVLPPGATPFSLVPMRENGEKDGADEIIQVDARDLEDKLLFQEFLVDDRTKGAKTLKDLWKEGLMTSTTDVDETVFLHATVSLAFLRALQNCKTTYCAFMEPDVFVHRHTDQKGWIDEAVEAMEANQDLVVMQAARLAGSHAARLRVEVDATSCSVVNSHDGSISQRYWIVNRNRLENHLPIVVDCAPRCDTFEYMFQLPTSSVGHMYCGSRSTWVVHPPENEQMLTRLFEGCAKNAGREEELEGYSVPDPRTGQRRLTEVPIPALPLHVGNDERVKDHFRRLAVSSWIGLPEFLNHIASDYDFGGAHTVAGGEQMNDDLEGWLCPRRHSEL